MKLFGNRRRAAHAAPRQKLPRGTRAAIIAVCVVLALTGGVFAAWKLLVKPVQRPSLSQPDPEPVSEPDEAEPSVIRVTPHETEQPEEEPEPDVPTEQPKALQDGVYNILICGTDDDGYPHRHHHRRPSRRERRTRSRSCPSRATRRSRPAAGDS